MTFTRLVHHFLENSAELFPEKNAFFISGRWHSYQDLNQRANKLSRLFQKSGVVKGDRVALFIENSMEYVVTYYAILKAGAVTVALNTESTIDDVEYIVRDCGVRVLVLSQNLFKRI